MAIACACLALLASGCGGAPSPLQRSIDATQGCADLLQSVTDADSARAAIDKIKPTFTELNDASTALGEAATDPEKAATLLQQAIELMPDLEAADGALKQELARLSSLKGLPVEFWNVFRVESFRLTRSQAASGALDPNADPSVVGAIDQILGMLEQHGPERVVEIELTNISVGDKDAAVARITELAGADAQVVSVMNPQDENGWCVAVAPVADFDKLIAAVDFGTVVESEKAKGEAKIELAAAEEESLAALGVAPEGDPAAVAPAEVAPAEAVPVAVVDDGRGGVMPPPDAGFVPPAEQGATGEGAAPHVTFADLHAGFSKFASNLTAAAAAQLEAGAVGGEPMPWQTNYHAQLAELLFDPQATHHEKAVLALLEVGPQDVADKKVRARIAQGYRFVALETGMHTAEAVRGLVVWGGKYSAPLLIELLEKNATGAEEAIFLGLGDIGTPEAAEAVVARIGASTSSEAAWACLRKMGSVAEGALIAALPFESPEANLAAIGVLADVGTKKCAAILRQATKSENEGVATAALDAIRKIRDRERASAPAE